jgi:hypothetical protein
MMLSEFEYSYFAPGGKPSRSLAMKSISFSGAGATVGEERTVFWTAFFLMKSGIPLVWLRSWRTVTELHAEGRPGSRSASVSSRERRPFWTSASALAPENALAMLAIRM